MIFHVNLLTILMKYALFVIFEKVLSSPANYMWRFMDSVQTMSGLSVLLLLSYKWVDLPFCIIVHYQYFRKWAFPLKSIARNHVKGLSITIAGNLQNTGNFREGFILLSFPKIDPSRKWRNYFVVY